MKLTYAVVLLCCSTHFVAAQATFRHIASPGTITANRTFIDHPELNARPDRIVIVTADYGSMGPYHDKAIGVWFDQSLPGAPARDAGTPAALGGKWTIFNQDRSAMTPNARFNVLVIPPGSGAFVHRASPANISSHITTLDHPSLNGRADAKFLVTQMFVSPGPYNNHPVGLYFAGGHWRVFNQNRAPMPAGAQFNIYIDDRIVEETASSPTSNTHRLRTAANATADTLIFVSQLWRGVYNPHEVGISVNGNEWAVLNLDRQPMPVNARFNILLADGPAASSALVGYVDMHTHPMSHLGFGRKAMHGVPDVGSLIPAGTRGCNKEAFRARNIAEALGDCNATHGGWGTDNTCGNYIRAAIINHAIDDDFVHKSTNAHGDHHHAGYPDFNFWPHQSSILHQQMYVDWIRRAWHGGLRVMVALAVNSELLAEILDGDNPKDDLTSANVQIDELIAFVGRHDDFMEVARSAADVRRIVRSGRLAVVLGVEIDNIGNFHRVRADENVVRREIQRLHAKGVRYVFPIHLVNNAFGGSAVYDMLFNFANKFSTGSYFKVETSRDRSINYSLAMTNGPMGLENGVILGLRGILEAVGQLPAPCFNDLFKCSPLPGKVSCCNQFSHIRNLITPSPEFDIIKTIPAGHVNTMGLTPLGEVAIREMMRLGMMIDLDHMSEKSMVRTMQIAESIPGVYPLNIGHNGIRGASGSERSITRQFTQRVARTGGVFGVGTSGTKTNPTNPSTFIESFRGVWTAMGGSGVAMGTDANGFEPLPQQSSTLDSKAFYNGFEQSRTGNRKWNYIKEGVAHYGLMADFLRDMRQQPGGSETVDRLMQSAEAFAQMWDRCERLAPR